MIADAKLRLSTIFLLLLTMAATSTALANKNNYGESHSKTGFFSPAVRKERILWREDQHTYRLRENNIIFNSETISQNVQVLINREHYTVDYLEGTISFTKRGVDVIEPDQMVNITYLIIPKNITKSFSLFRSIDYTDTTAVRSVESRGLLFALPDTDLDISGSKTFGVSLGSDEDFSISQTLFLRIDGELRRNLWIQAQLSDSHSPLTPEGDTRELSSLDQIFIRIFGRIPDDNRTINRHNSRDRPSYSEYEIAFGDLEMSFYDTQFINYRTTFEGVKAEWQGTHDFKAALALAKGKQSITEFRGLDGKQGPYFLALEQTGTYVQVIPGSEEVYLDGILLERGTDYRINYSEGSITFTSSHFIDSNSSVYVRYQYTDEEFRQYKYLTGNSVEITDRLNVGFYLIHETDDKNNPLAGDLTDQEIEILRQAGDDSAWTDGVNKVEMGEGDYIKKTDDDQVYYEFVGSNQGDHVVYFSYVGSSNGSYNRQAPGHFVFVGENNGSWIPERRLPSPESRSNYDINLQYRGNFWRVDGEAIYTYKDDNTFSDIDSDDNQGYATHWQLSLNPQYDRFNPELRLYYSFLSKNLNTFTDINDPNIFHGISRQTEIDTVDINEFGTNISLANRNIWNTTVRFFRRTGKDDEAIEKTRSFFNDNLLLSIFLSQQTFIPQINYRYRYYYNKVTADKLEDNEQFIDQGEEPDSDSQATQHNHFLNLTRTLSNLRVSGDFSQRTYQEELVSQKKQGFRFRSKRLDIGSYRTQKIAGNVFISLDKNFNYIDNWDKQRKSMTIGKESMVVLFNQNLRASYSHRKVTTYPEKNETYYDIAEISLNSALLNRGVNTVGNYSLVNTEFFPRARELIFVGKSQGIYDSTGVAVEDGEYDYITVPVGDPEMSIEINANLNFHISPRQFLREVADNEKGILPLTKLALRRIQTESSILISENIRTEEKWDVYLLKNHALMDNDNTIYGRYLHRHTLWVDLITRRLTGKLMFQENKTLDNRYDDTVESYTSVHEFMLRLTRFINTDFEITYELREEHESRYLSEIQIDNYKLDIRNRLSRDLNLTTLLQYSYEQGGRQEGSDNYRIHSFSMAETVSYFFQSKYRLFGRLEYRYNKREGSGFLTFLPYKREGSVFRWNTRLNYQLNRYTTASFTYNGNKYPLQDTVHSIKVEFRAEF